jgi:hypothetical protein
MWAIGQVAEGEPQHHEQQHGRELDALGEGAHDQCAGDAGERGLEGCEGDLGNHHALAEGGRVGKGARCVVPDALHEQPVKAADEGIAFGERQAVAIDEPQHDDQRERDHDLHQHRQHVLAAHQAAVEQRQAGHGHQDHQQVATIIQAVSPLLGTGAEPRPLLLALRRLGRQQVLRGPLQRRGR